MHVSIRMHENHDRPAGGPAQGAECLAARRGLRGFSPLIQEALAAYLSHLDLDEVDLLLTLEGSMSEQDELRLRAGIDEAWSAWRVS